MLHGQSADGKPHAPKLPVSQPNMRPSFPKKRLPRRLQRLVEKRRFLEDARLVEESGYFDAQWYLGRYPDVAGAGLDPLHHFVRSGGAEGRAPSRPFDRVWYQVRDQNIRKKGLNPLVQYLRAGVEWVYPAMLPASGLDVAAMQTFEKQLRASVIPFARQFANIANGPLYPDDFPFLEAIVRTALVSSKAPAPCRGFAARLLKAGRSTEAIEFLEFQPDDAVLGKERGRRELLKAAAAREAPDRVPPIRQNGIVYLLHNSLPYNSGGYAVRAHGLLQGYRDVGWSVFPVGRLGYPLDREMELRAPTETVDGITYTFLPGPESVDQADQIGYVEQYARRVLDALPHEQIGMVQAASFFPNGLAGRIIADRLGVPLVYEMRGMEWFTRGSRDQRWFGSEQSLMVRDLELAVARCADHVLAITKALKDWLVVQGIPAEKISLLPNGCEAAKFQPKARDADLARTLGIENAFVVAYIGSVVFYEGLELIGEAVRRARERSDRDIRYLIVGDGPNLKNAVAIMKANGPTDWLIVAGRVPHSDVPAYYSVVDALVLARRTLPVCELISPLKPFEAMAMEKLVITSDVAAMKEIVEAAGAGMMFPAGDADRLADVILAAMNEPASSQAHAKRAREWVLNERNWSVLARTSLNDITTRLGRAA